jgi:hypothetical protein
LLVLGFHRHLGAKADPAVHALLLLLLLLLLTTNMRYWQHSVPKLRQQQQHQQPMCSCCRSLAVWIVCLTYTQGLARLQLLQLLLPPSARKRQGCLCFCHLLHLLGVVVLFGFQLLPVPLLQAGAAAASMEVLQASDAQQATLPDLQQQQQQQLLECLGRDTAMSQQLLLQAKTAAWAALPLLFLRAVLHHFQLQLQQLLFMLLSSSIRPVQQLQIQHCLQSGLQHSPRHQHRQKQQQQQQQEVQ